VYGSIINSVSLILLPFSFWNWTKKKWNSRSSSICSVLFFIIYISTHVDVCIVLCISSLSWIVTSLTRGKKISIHEKNPPESATLFFYFLLKKLGTKKRLRDRYCISLPWQTLSFLKNWWVIWTTNFRMRFYHFSKKLTATDGSHRDRRVISRSFHHTHVWGWVRFKEIILFIFICRKKKFGTKNLYEKCLAGWCNGCLHGYLPGGHFHYEAEGGTLQYYWH
jgi:hypothetical protein